MIRLPRHYLAYRRVGFGRLPALRFAWLVFASERRSLLLRATVRS